ncbi:alpha/beta fold hydrolase [Bacillus velezensis]|uniref:alpha/beta fold hydrolase n=1 Tax=Bacillus velezensis TaxID=492670 RepID=UPI0012EA56B8|nr:alpha/beta fold hydrolase [Bacillus velezensis]
MRFSVLVKHDDYIVSDHVLHQVRTIPGVTYLDLITRFLAEKGISPRSFEIKHVLFREPVATSVHFDKKVTFQFTEQENGWLVETTSRKWVAEKAEGEASVNLQAEIIRKNAINEKTISIEALKKGAVRTSDAEAAYRNLRRGGLIHKDFMKLEGTVYEGENYILGEVSLSGLSKEYTNDFYMHPAFLDGSLSLLGILTSDLPDEGTNAFIPIYIETFRALHKTTGSCFVYINKNSITQPPSKDILYADIEVYRPDGELAFYYERFGVKRVRNEKSIQRLEHSHKAKEVGSVTNNKEMIRNNLIQEIAGMIEKPAETVKNDISFYEMGLDSKQLLDLSKKLELMLDTKLYPTLLFDYSTIGELTEFLQEKYGARVTDSISDTVQHQDSQKTLTDELSSIIGDVTNTPPNKADKHQSFYELGLDSKQLLHISKMLEERLDTQLYPTLLFDYNNIHDLAAYLEEKYNVRNTPAAAVKEKTQTKEPFEKPVLDSLYLQKEWIESPLKSGEVPKENTLIFDFDSSLSDEIRKYIGSENVIYAEAAAEYEMVNEKHYKFNPEQSAHYTRLLDDMKKSGAFPASIIHYLSKKAYTEAALDLTHSFYSILYLSKALIRQKTKDNINLLYVHDKDQYTNPIYAAIGGFFKTLNAEQPNIKCKTVEISSRQTIEKASLLLNELSAGHHEAVKYDGDQKRRVTAYKDASLQPGQKAAKFVKNGVYLIIGGLSGIGWIISAFIYANHGASVIIAGRSKMTAEMEEKLDSIRYDGANISYIQADMSDKQQVINLAEKIHADYSEINGVIYSAGVLKDSFIMNKTDAEAQAVLQSKVNGVIHLDEALRNMPLDFFVLFSSISSEIGSLGQADYAYANRFLEHFAEWRECMRKEGGRSGKTIAVNWPFWKDGGMSVDPGIQDIMKTEYGLHPLENTAGIKAFEHSLLGQGHQLIVLYGEKEKIQNDFKPLSARSAPPLVRDSAIAADFDASSIVMEEEAESPFRILGTASNRHLDDYLHYWSRLKKGALRHDQSDAAKKLIAFYQTEETETVHFLANTENARHMEILMSGKGETILLICGFATTAYMWKEQMKEWADQFNVIVIHTPGYGLSEGSADFTLSGLAQTFIEVLNEIGVAWPIHIAAASWGGMIGQRIAYEYPEKVKTLILSGSYTEYEEDPESSVEEKLKNDFIAIGKSHEYESLYSNQFLNASIERFMKIHQQEGYSTIGFLKDIHTRTLILTGEKESVVDQKETKRLKKLLSNSELKKIKGAGHLPNITHPEEFNKAVSEFIKKSVSKG